jgi:vitamin B12 transporter
MDSVRTGIVFALFLITVTGRLMLMGTEIDLGEVTITDRIDESMADDRAESFTTIINVPESSSTESLAALLRAESGIHITSTGGESAVSTISLRGSTSKNVLVMIDGIPVNSSGFSSVDLNFIQTSIIERIEITRGGESALHGSNAMGGTINIITRKAKSSGGNITVSAAGGRKVSEQASVTLSGKHIDFIISQGARFDTGVYQFVNSNGTMTESDDFTDLRQNNSLTATSVMAGVSGRMPKGISIQGSTLFLRKQNGVAGPSGFTSLFTDAELIRTYLHNRIYFDTGRVSPHVNFVTEIFHTINDSIYSNSNESGSGPYSSAKQMHTWGGSLSGTILAIPFNTLKTEVSLSGELLHDRITGNSIENSPSRFTVSFMVRDEILLWKERIGIIPTMRFDYATGPGFHFSWKAGFFIKPVNPLTVRFSTFHSYRNPDFTEQFFTYGLYSGNPDLRPEQVYGGDLGFTWKHEKIRVETALFFNYYLDLIRYIVSFGYIFKPVNIDSAYSFGGELMIDYRPFDFFSLQAQYTLNYLLDAGDLSQNRVIQLPGQPLHKVTFTMEFIISSVTLGFQSVIEDRTIITRNGTKYLPSRQVFNCYLTLDFTGDNEAYSGTIFINANNLLNVQLEDYRGYPLEGFMVDAGVSINF